MLILLVLLTSFAQAAQIHCAFKIDGDTVAIRTHSLSNRDDPESLSFKLAFEHQGLRASFDWSLDTAVLTLAGKDTTQISFSRQTWRYLLEQTFRLNQKFQSNLELACSVDVSDLKSYAWSSMKRELDIYRTSLDSLLGVLILFSEQEEDSPGEKLKTETSLCYTIASLLEGDSNRHLLRTVPVLQDWHPRRFAGLANLYYSEIFWSMANLRGYCGFSAVDPIPYGDRPELRIRSKAIRNALLQMDSLITAGFPSQAD